MDTNHPPQQTRLLQAGQEALARGAWEEARSAFERTLSTSDTAGQTSRDELPAGANAEILSGLAEALWWLGEIRRALDCWERAYLGFRQKPDPAQATAVAIQLSLLYQANLGNRAAASGWVARASRLVDEHALEPLRGWVLIAGAVDAPDAVQHEASARTAHELGQAYKDRDLELCALTQIGVALIDQGRVAEGTAFHDEAMAGSLAGEGQPDTVVFTSCEMMTSYGRCAQYQRMAQWIRAADRFVERYGCPYLSASCRTYYGEVLFATGAWSRAEGEFRAALRLSETSLPAVQAEALARLAELRLAQGRIEEAEPDRENAWSHSDPTILQAQGSASAVVATLIADAGLGGPNIRILDIGTGVAGLAIAFCRTYPDSTVVGLDPWEPSLAIARANVSEADLEDRIALRGMPIQAFEDGDGFDLVWLPSFFISEAGLDAAFRRVRGLLRPGGSLAVGIIEGPEDPLAGAVDAMITVRSGGSVLKIEEAMQRLERAGFCHITEAHRTWQVPLRLVFAWGA